MAILPIAMAGASLASSLFGQSKQRKENRRAEADARAHNKEMWNLQNEYNHPSQQMGRLQEAGLNPNMIYGTSPSSAVGSAGDVAPGKAPDQPYELPNPMQEFSRYANINQAKAQTDNLRTQNTVLTQEALFKSAQTAESLTKNARNEFDLMLAKELKETSVDAAKENLRNMRANTTGQYLQNYFNDATMANRVESVALQIQNAKATLTGTQLANQMKRFETELNQLGLTKNDPLYMRLIQTGQVPKMGQQLDSTLDRGIQNISDKVRDYLGPSFKNRFPKN